MQANAGETLPASTCPAKRELQWHIIARFGTVPISPRETHIVLDALGPLLAELFEETG